MNVSEHKFIFLLVSLTENSPVTSLLCHQFRCYLSGMWWAIEFYSTFIIY